MDNLDALTSEAVTLLEQLIATPRISRGEAEAATLLYDFIALRRTDDRGRELFSLHRSGNNIWCIPCSYDAQRPTLLMNAHIDTVKPVSAWTRDPFLPSREGDRLYGLGSNDDGASLVSLLQAFRVLVSRPQSCNFIFLASAEEEVSGHDGIESALPQLPPVSVALVGEPTRMQPAIAEKGLMVLDCTATGKAGHAARNEGVNAIYRAIEDINWFRTYQFPEASELLGPVKMSVTIINAGTQHNVVPDSCTFTVDVRSNECYSNQDICDHLRAAVQSDVRPRSLRLNSSHIAPDHPLVLRALALGDTLNGEARHTFGSPTLSDQALMAWPSLKMGPGDSSRSHTADEYIRIPEIHNAIGEYITMLSDIQL